MVQNNQSISLLVQSPPFCAGLFSGSLEILCLTHVCMGARSAIHHVKSSSFLKLDFLEHRFARVTPKIMVVKRYLVETSTWLCIFDVRFRRWSVFLSKDMNLRLNLGLSYEGVSWKAGTNNESKPDNKRTRVGCGKLPRFSTKKSSNKNGLSYSRLSWPLLDKLKT